MPAPHTAPDPDHGHGPDHPHLAPDRPLSLQLWSPAGVVAQPAALRRAARHLGRQGFAVGIDAGALARHQRFAGDDASRLAALHRLAEAAPDVVLASRGGYGLTRLLDGIDWPRIARSIAAGTRWVGYSDLTAFQNAALAHRAGPSWAGPLACDDFGRTAEEGGIDEVTEGCFLEAMRGELEAIGFRTGPDVDGLERSGTLWGGNLTVLCSLLGTPHWPRVRGGILFLEDVNEHPYRIERQLLQLAQAGVLDAQKAVLLGSFSGWARSPLDRGYSLKTALAAVRARVAVPLLEGLPFGHQRTKVCLPVGRKVTLAVQGRDAFVAWGH